MTPADHIRARLAVLRAELAKASSEPERRYWQWAVDDLEQALEELEGKDDDIH